MAKNLDERIAIIGGGPAGISAGMYLQLKGYKNYTIFEKTDHVGGKCHSPHCVGKGGDRRYEMGAIMGVPSYFAVHDVEQFAGVTHDGPKLQRAYKNLDGSPDTRFDKKLWRIPHLLKLKKQIKKFGELLESEYKGYDVAGHRGVCEGRYEGFAVTPGREPVSGKNENLKNLSMPFDEFTKMVGCPLVQEIWIGPFTSFGYGYFDEIPAAYVLKYLDFRTMMDFVKVNLWTWKEGTQSIYEAANAKLANPARLNQNITKIERRDGKVFVTANGKEEEFDKLILTTPLQVGEIKNPVAQGLDTYLDVTEQERALFSRIDYERYDTMAFITKPECYPDTSYYIMRNMEPDRLGHVMVFYRRWANEPDQPLVTYVLRKHKDKNETVEQYKAKPEVGYEEAKAMALKDIEDFGVPATKVIYEFQTYYFPHVFSEDYANGWYEKVEAMQGKLNTFYAGEVMSFGDMDETVEYSRDLVERFF